MIPQRINFYQPQFHPQRDYLSARYYPLYAGGLILVLALFSLVLMHKQSGLKAKIQGLRNEKASIELSMVELGRNMQEIPKDDALESRTLAREQELNRREDELKILTGLHPGNVEGFSPMLEGLARTVGKGIWLTAVILEQGGREFAVAGRAVRQELIPGFVERLVTDPGFLGRSIQSLEVGASTDGEGDEVMFVLGNIPREEIKKRLEAMTAQGKAEGESKEGNSAKGEEGKGAGAGGAPVRNLPPGLVKPKMLPPGMLPKELGGGSIAPPPPAAAPGDTP
ncbi:MAG: hypothetical protein HQL51_16655 [Magnetococcales bacterium]|nr:hypothetical protein [Magnetococcales bacterium]